MAVPSATRDGAEKYISYCRSKVSHGQGKGGVESTRKVELRLHSGINTFIHFSDKQTSTRRGIKFFCPHNVCAMKRVHPQDDRTAPTWLSRE